MSTTSPITPIPSDVAPVQPAQSVAPVPAAKSGTSATNTQPSVDNLAASSPPTTPLDTQSDLRLVIEEDKAAGSYVYVTIDPVTGKVVSQIPREQLLKMRESPDYRPGAVFNSRS